MKWLGTLLLVWVHGVRADVSVIQAVRRTSQLVEAIEIKSSRDGETLLVSTNRWLKGPRIGMFTRRSTNFLSKAKAYAYVPPPEPRPVLPEEWEIWILGRELAQGSNTAAQVLTDLASELSNAKLWTPVETAEVELKSETAIFTYRKKGAVKRVERRPMFEACRTMEGRMGCMSEMGVIFLENL